MLYAVIDTNVLVSAALARNQIESVPYLILLEILKKSFIPIVDESIVEEYKEVLFRTKFGFIHKEAENVIEIILKNALKVSIPSTGKILPDMDDVIFYDVAFANQDKGAYLVTGNTKHFPDCEFVVTPRTFMNIVNPVIPSVVNEDNAIYDPTGLLAAFQVLNANAQKNGTIGMSEEEIEAEIKLMHEERRRKRNG
ncbi:MAG: PIN domain-containing protein [Fibrobacter sp.]|nr:PIN domain-containing protein [Fibrobacter sp.]